MMSERFGATNPKALALRFHAQTGGSTLTAQQPENNIVRVAIQALSAVCGGAQSLHTNSFDEALALPTERAARIALRTQQILAARGAAPTDTADPLGGSYFIEALTDELEAARVGADRADRRARRRGRGGRGGFVQARDRGSRRSAGQQQVESGERADRRRQPLRRGRGRGDRAAPARPRGASGARSSERAACGPSGTPAEARRRSRAVRRGARGDGEHAAADARGAPRARARSARSARCCARSGACTTARSRRASAQPAAR